MKDGVSSPVSAQYISGIDAAMKEYENAVRYGIDPRARMDVLRAKAEQLMLNQPQLPTPRVLTEDEARDVRAVRSVLEIFGGAHTVAGFERLVAALLCQPQGGGNAF